MNSLVLYLPTGWKQVGLHDVHSESRLHYEPVGQVVWGHVCWTELWANEDSHSVYFVLDLHPLCPAGALDSYRCNNRVIPGASVDCEHQADPSW